MNCIHDQNAKLQRIRFTRKQTPYQNDNVSCGMFCLLFLAFCMEGLSVPQTIELTSVESIRQWMECMIRTGKPPTNE